MGFTIHHMDPTTTFNDNQLFKLVIMLGFIYLR